MSNQLLSWPDILSEHVLKNYNPPCKIVSQSQTHVYKDVFRLLAFLATNHLTCESYPRYGKYPSRIIDSALGVPPLGRYHNPFMIFPVPQTHPYIK